MKKTILLLLLFAGAFMNSYAQADSTGINFRKHEIKVGGVKLIAGGIVEATYEYLHSPYFTYGASILGNLDKNNGYPEDFAVTPFARFYFTESKEYGAKGFFVEGFAKYITGHEYYYDYDSYTGPDGEYIYNEYERKDSYNTVSAGLALGWKWVNHAGFVFEVLVGAGNNFNSSAPEASFRGDLNIGYRF